MFLFTFKVVIYNMEFIEFYIVVNKIKWNYIEYEI